MFFSFFTSIQPINKPKLYKNNLVYVYILHIPGCMFIDFYKFLIPSANLIASSVGRFV